MRRWVGDDNGRLRGGKRFVSFIYFIFFYFWFSVLDMGFIYFYFEKKQNREILLGWDNNCLIDTVKLNLKHLILKFACVSER